MVYGTPPGMGEPVVSVNVTWPSWMSHALTTSFGGL